MQVKRPLVVVSCLFLSVCIAGYLFIYSNKRGETVQYKDVEGIDDSEENSVENSVEASHDHFFHPANPTDLWLSMYNKRLAIRRLAYYDNRDHTHPTILVNAMYDLRIKEKPKIYAKLNYNNNKTKCLELEFKMKSGDYKPEISEIYVYFLLSTREAVFEKPSSIDISENVNCLTINDTLSVRSLVPLNGKKLFNYGVCIHKGLYNIQDPQVLIDWIELNKVLGAEILIIYSQTFSEQLYKSIINYVKSGFVEIINWNLHEPTIPKLYTLDNGMSGVLNECIYLNMYRVKFLALNDIDEYIAPELPFKKVPQMLSHLEKITEKNPVSAYQFHNTYYFEDSKTMPQLKGWSPLCPRVKIPRYFKRTQRATHAEKYGSDKLVVQTARVNIAQVHYIVDAREGYAPVLSVPNEIGRSNHYRWPYRMEHFTPHEYSNVMGRYVGSVLPEIERQICHNRSTI